MLRFRIQGRFTSVSEHWFAVVGVPDDSKAGPVRWLLYPRFYPQTWTMTATRATPASDDVPGQRRRSCWPGSCNLHDAQGVGGSSPSRPTTRSSRRQGTARTAGQNPRAGPPPGAGRHRERGRGGARRRGATGRGRFQNGQLGRGLTRASACAGPAVAIRRDTGSLLASSARRLLGASDARDGEGATRQSGRRQADAGAPGGQTMARPTKGYRATPRSRWSQFWGASSTTSSLAPIPRFRAERVARAFARSEA